MDLIQEALLLSGRLGGAELARQVGDVVGAFLALRGFGGGAGGVFVLHGGLDCGHQFAPCLGVLARCELLAEFGRGAVGW